MSQTVIPLDLAWHRAIVQRNHAAKYYEKSLEDSRKKIRGQLEQSKYGLQMLLDRLTKDTSIFDCGEVESIQESPSLAYFGPSDLIQPPPVQTPLLSDAVSDYLDSICVLRTQLYELAAANANPRLFSSIIDDIEELETRALLLIVLPPVVSGEDSGGNQLGILKGMLERLKNQAVKCVEAAKQLLTSAPVGTPESTPDAWIHRPIPISIPPPSSSKSLPSLREAKDFINIISDSLYPVLSDYKLRERSLRIKRIISCACSQITRHDPEHCLNRLRHILTFLSDKPIPLSGASIQGHENTQITLSELIPGEVGQSYAWQCLFSATLSQAEHQFSHNPETASVFALVLSAILSKYPDRVYEFIARTFLACPLLATFLDDQSVELAREMSESVDLLARWRGLARLFGALTVLPLPKDKRSTRPPHLNPSLLWRIIAGMTNKPFLLGSTAEVIHGLLDVADTSLSLLYGVQYDKLLSTITTLIESSEELRISSPEMALLSTIELSQKR